MTITEFSTAFTLAGVGLTAIGLYISTREEKSKLGRLFFVLTSGLIIVGSLWFVNTYDFRTEYNEMSEEELLQKAQDYYDIEEYIEASYLYENEKLDTNEIAMNNLAYLYENGLGVAKDLNKADALYYKASKLENNNAKENYVAFALRHPHSYPQILEVLELGYQISDEEVLAWMAQGYSGKALKDISVGEYKDYAQGFLEMDLEKQLKYIRRDIYIEEIPKEYYMGVENSSFIEYEDRQYEKKLFTGAYEVITEDESEERTPIFTTVQSLGTIVKEQRLPIGDKEKTKYIRLE